LRVQKVIQNLHIKMRNESETDRMEAGKVKLAPGHIHWVSCWVAGGIHPFRRTPNTQIEHTCWDPKDRELFLHRLKPGENLVEDRSGTDVQIVSSNVGIAAKD